MGHQNVKSLPDTEHLTISYILSCNRYSWRLRRGECVSSRADVVLRFYENVLLLHRTKFTSVILDNINVSCLCHRSMYERDGAVGEQHQPHPEEPGGGAGCCGVREGCWLRPVPGTPCTPLRLLPVATPRPVAGPGASHAASTLAGAEGLGLTRWHDAPAHRSVLTLLTPYTLVPSWQFLNISSSF